MISCWASALLATTVDCAGALIASKAAAFCTRGHAAVSLPIAAVLPVSGNPRYSSGKQEIIKLANFRGGRGRRLYSMFSLIGRYVCPICASCSMGTLEGKAYLTHNSALILLSIVLSLHCLIDGLSLIVATTARESLGLRVLAAVAAHKLPEGFALALILTVGNRSPWNAFCRTCGIQSATLAGALAGSLGYNPLSSGSVWCWRMLAGAFSTSAPIAY
jgi:ZIP Zinc transporter